MATTTDNPARTFFGTELRRRRDEAGLTGKQLADSLGCTPQWISVMEGGKKISEQSAHDLDTYFKTGGLFHRLWKLANDIELQTTLPPGFPEYAEREKRANSIRVYSALLVNGLFQTEGYIRAVMGGRDQQDKEDLVQQRLKRQSILTQDNAPHTWFTIDESALRRVIGGPAIMREQLQHLIDFSDHPSTMVQVVPHGVGYHPGLTGSFTILGYKDGSQAAYTESAGAGMLIEHPPRVADYAVRWDMIRGHARSVEESRALLTAVMESL
ncbi:helix-turn-helix transcriptional regulator [Actinomadura viridis]|uniref:Transcriptional regulator with XRE-family HTH domain n=1 Tax=Actinomadura viridis TaxID=58110 RepID=A0A931GLK7_9ACTN|nr:helix-turn-helix transcriptional regulator [Actinomadura viridis]MBG6087561.1 transcriptional regulator with XRE-family HTH domain [Actinomadura viridis]